MKKIPLLLYNKPLKSGTIYTEDSIINKAEVLKQGSNRAFFVLTENPKTTVVPLCDVIFIANPIFENDGMFISDLIFIETDENIEFLKRKKDKRLGLATCGMGHVTNKDNIQIANNVEIFCAAFADEPVQNNSINISEFVPKYVFYPKWKRKLVKGLVNVYSWLKSKIE